MPQSAQHKAKIASGVKAYHACARSKGCGGKKSVAKKAKKIQSTYKKDARVDKILENRMKATAKAKLQQRLRDRKKKKATGGGAKAVAKPVRKRRTKREMAEAKAMGMEDRDAPKKPVRKPAKKPVKKPAKKAKEVFFKPGTYDEEEERNEGNNIIGDYYEAEQRAYQDQKYMERFDYYNDERRGEERAEKLMDASFKHARRFTKKIFNKVKKKKFKTRKEFEEAFRKEMGYNL